MPTWRVRKYEWLRDISEGLEERIVVAEEIEAEFVALSGDNLHFLDRWDATKAIRARDEWFAVDRIEGT